MNEAALFHAILEDPSNPVPRLVYADWLEEKADQASLYQAEYLRVECQLDALPSGDSKRRRLRERLNELRQVVGDEWWRQFDWAKVEYCVEFGYECPQRWDTLQSTDDPAVRHCSGCRQNVYYCESVEEAHRRADVNECVAIDSRLVKLSFPRERTLRHSDRRMRMGRVLPRSPHRLPLPKRSKPNNK